jgi:hypothetical protein
MILSLYVRFNSVKYVLLIVHDFIFENDMRWTFNSSVPKFTATMDLELVNLVCAARVT